MGQLDLMESLGSQSSLTTRVHDAILEAICDGRLPPGERLTQDEIARRLGVSRMPVGQALMLLKTEGFVIDAGRRGVKVAPLDAGLVREICEFRSGLELVSARAAARNCTSADARAGRAILAEGTAALEAGDMWALIAAEVRFHTFLYRLSGNTLVQESMERHWHHIRRVMHEVLRDARFRARVWDEHRQILDAVADGDGERAEALARAHVEESSQRLIAAMSQAPAVAE